MLFYEHGSQANLYSMECDYIDYYSTLVKESKKHHSN